jgi:hypothetical protein
MMQWVSVPAGTMVAAIPRKVSEDSVAAARPIDARESSKAIDEAAKIQQE